MDVIKNIIDTIAAVRTISSVGTAIWSRLSGDKCRIDGAFLRDSASGYKPILCIRNISNRIVILDYVDIFYDEKLLKRLNFSEEYQLKDYAKVPPNETVEIPIDSKYLEIDEEKYKEDEMKDHVLKFDIKLRKGRGLVLRQKLSLGKSNKLFFLEGLFGE